MSALTFGVAVELVVIIMLAMTIGYCVLLNRRLKCLKADEAGLRGTIGELITATEIAERAIRGLKATIADCERTLTARLGEADRSIGTLEREKDAAEALVTRIAQITAAGRPASPQEEAAAQATREPDHPATPVRATGALQAAAREAAERLQGYRQPVENAA